MLELSDGIHAPQFVIDTDGDGAVTFSGSIGPFSFNVATGVSKPILGTALNPVLDLNSVDVTSGQGGGGTLTLELTDTDFVGNGVTAQFLSSVSGSLSGGSYSVSTFLDCGNAAFAQSIPLTSKSLSSASFTDDQNASIGACLGSYSLTILSILQLPGDAMFSGDEKLSLVVSEPTTLAILGLAGLGVMRRRRAA